MEEKTEVLHTERDYGAEILSIIRSGKDSERIKEELSEYHENDIASIFEELTLRSERICFSFSEATRYPRLLR